MDLRHIYHKSYKGAKVHLYLGILANWLVNTIRHQFKAKQINSSWIEIVSIANMQKVITTTGQNALDREVSIRKCFIPNKKLQVILDILKLKHKPPGNKICSTQNNTQNFETPLFTGSFKRIAAMWV